MISIFQAESTRDMTHAEKLNWEYLEWINAMTLEELNVNVDIKSMHDQDMLNMYKFSQPYGRLLLSEYNSQIAGMGCLRKIQKKICEIKRMYVRPVYRGKGIGKALLDMLIDEAQSIGYRAVRLDSANFMTGAHPLYRAAGFTDIDPYPESDIPEEFHSHCLFMEKRI